MKKYFKIDNLEELGILHYVEFNEEWVTREINFYDKNFYDHKDRESEWDLSIDNKHLSFRGWSLSYLGFSEQERISPEEFEKTWQIAMDAYLKHKENQARVKNPKKEQKKLEEAIKLSTDEKKRQRAKEKEIKNFWENFWENPPNTTYHKGQNLFITKTEHTPDIRFEYDTGNFSIIGSSMFDEPTDFYWPLSNWVENYLKHNQDKTISLVLDLGILGTHDSLMIADLILQVSSNSQVEWLFANEDQEEQGIDFAEFYNLSFFLVNKYTGDRYEINNE